MREEQGIVNKNQSLSLLGLIKWLFFLKQTFSRIVYHSSVKFWNLNHGPFLLKDYRLLADIEKKMFVSKAVNKSLQ